MAMTLDVYETRRDNLTKLLEHKGAKTQLATRLGATQSHITHLLKPPTAASARQIKEETARQIEDAMGLPRGELDRPHQADVIIHGKNGEPTVVVEMKHTAPSPDEPALLEAVAAAVLAELERLKVKVSSEKTAGMMRIVYEHARSSGHVDRALIATLVKLIK
jgi:hypothetical protein